MITSSSSRKQLALLIYALILFGHIICMLKFLQVESQSYFRNRNYAEVFSTLESSRQRTSFYTMLITAHLSSNVEIAVNYLAETSIAKLLDISALLSAVWGLSLQMNANSDEAKKLFNLVSIIHARNIIDKSQLLADLPEWVAQGANLIEAAAFERRTARVYTKINYEQSKYGLLRQNNEGYAKMTLLLINLRDSHDIQSIWHRMLDLVGNFDLDPDRVLDLIIEARVHNHSTNNYLKLLRNFRRESITAVLGNKLRQLKGKPIDAALFQKAVYVGSMETFEASSIEDVDQAVSPHLISMCAELIKKDLLTYQDILPYLEPGDYAIRHLNSKRVELALQKIKECFTLNTEELDQSEKVKLHNEENLKFEGQLLHSTKLALISQLVRLNDWTDFEAAWAPFKDKIDLLLYQPLLKHLLNLLEWAIEPLSQDVGYQRFFRFEKKGLFFISEGSTKEHGRINSLEESDLQALDLLLSYIGKYIGFRPRLFIKLCRMFKRQAKEGNSEKVKPFIENYLMMGSCVAENNAAISIELFELLDCYDYHFRYECYLKVYQGGMSDCPYVARIFESIKRKQNIMVNNLSKENKKVFIRKIAKFTHNQALPVFYWIIRRIVMEDYEAVVPEIVAVICNCSPLTLDMAIFVMLYTLNENREPPVNCKTHDCLPWFKNVTTFISNFFRKYLETDIQPVFDYIIMKTGKLPDLEDDELPGDLLKLLHEILNKMHGSVVISEINKTKYDAIAAGPKLQAEILELTSEVRAAKKSKIFLQKFFWEKNAVHKNGFSLAFNLLVLLAQKRAQLFTKSFIDDIKIVGEIFDQYSLLIVQVVRVLLYQAQDYNHYAQLLPADPIRVLLRDYKISLEIVCEVVRPGIKHIAMMTPEEWTQLTTDFSNAYLECLRDQKYVVKSSRLGEKWTALLSAYKTKVLEYLPIPFFTAFWFLTLDSVYFPAKSYTEKIDDLKKKIQPGKKGDRGERNQRQLQRMRTLYDKLIKEQDAQRKKYNDTLSEQNLKKLEVDILHSSTDKGKDAVFVFAEQFVQSCLLPRMMLDRTEALYCVKFTIEMIKANKMAVTKSIRLLTFIIEYVMGYLPFTTHREASHCISVFLAEILAIFNNWNDSIKLKQDLKRILGVEDTGGKDNYPKLKDYLVKLYERVGNTLRGVREEPYLIKNCLYILQKVDTIPSYKEQADELAQHMTELKQMFPTVDMRTSLDRQIAMLTSKKADLPDRPERAQDKKNATKPEEPKIIPSEITVTKAIPMSKSPISIHPNVSNNGTHKKQPEIKQSENRPAERQIERQIESRPVQSRHKSEVRLQDKSSERAINQQKHKSRFTFEKPAEKKAEQKPEQKKKDDFSKRPEPRNPLTGAVYSVQSRFTEQKVEVKTSVPFIGPPKTVKEMREEMLRQNALVVNQNTASTQNATGAPIAHPVVGPSQASLGITAATTTSATAAIVTVQPVPTTGDPSQINAAKPSQQESKLIAGPPLRSQKPASSAAIDQPTQINQTSKPIQKETKAQGQEKLPQKKQNNQVKPKQTQIQPPKNSPKPEKIQKQPKQKLEKRDQRPSPTPQRKKEDRWRDKDNSFKRDHRQTSKEYKDKDKDRQRDNRERDNRDNRERQNKSKTPAYVFIREPNKSEQNRKQEKREKSKEREKDRSKQRQKDKQREREKDKQRERRYDKYHRSRSREKYGRR